MLEIRLDKPKVNAIDHPMSRELGEAFRTLRDEPELRVAILTAEDDRIFSAGWDLNALDAGDAQLDEWWAESSRARHSDRSEHESGTALQPSAAAQAAPCRRHRRAGGGEGRVCAVDALMRVSGK